LEIVGVRVSGRYFRDFSWFNVCFQVKIAFLLDALQLPMLFVGLLTHLELK
jgi:hypothetical protein